MKSVKISTLCLLLILLCPALVLAQHDNPPPGADDGGKPFMTGLESTLSILVLSFGLIIVFLEVYLIKVNKMDANNSIKFIILTLIITGTLFLITAGYDTQLTPVLGLLGTIAGYLLGKGENIKEPVKETPKA